jgi:hypothetical protein
VTRRAGRRVEFCTVPPRRSIGLLHPSMETDVCACGGFDVRSRLMAPARYQDGGSPAGIPLEDGAAPGGEMIVCMRDT